MLTAEAPAALSTVTLCPSANWLAAVAAPVGRDTVPETLVMFHVPDWDAGTTSSVAFVTRRVPASLAPVPREGWVPPTSMLRSPELSSTETGS